MAYTYLVAAGTLLGNSHGDIKPCPAITILEETHAEILTRQAGPAPQELNSVDLDPDVVAAIYAHWRATYLKHYVPIIDCRPLPWSAACVYPATADGSRVLSLAVASALPPPPGALRERHFSDHDYDPETAAYFVNAHELGHCLDMALLEQFRSDRALLPVEHEAAAEVFANTFATLATLIAGGSRACLKATAAHQRRIKAEDIAPQDRLPEHSPDAMMAIWRAAYRAIEQAIDLFDALRPTFDITELTAHAATAARRYLEELDDAH